MSDRALTRWRRVLRAAVPWRPKLSTVPEELLESKRAYFGGRRTFSGGADFDVVRELAAMADRVVRIDEAAALEDRAGRILAIRHDVDHDLENAVRMARREAEAGLRTSYYFLHTDWYYRAGPGEPLSSLVVGSMREIASLGHEIGLHNNVITAALLSGQDPAEVLRQELDALAASGFSVTGTVAHGDPLCRKAGFVNSEIFSEFPRPVLGPPDRALVHEDGGRRQELTLRPRPMAEFGLVYEAGFIGHKHYLSDTGGRWSVPVDVIRERFARDGGLLQILTHPVWWALEDEAVRPRPPREMPTPILGGKQ